MPFAIFFLLSFFQNLSFTFEEAAAVDGYPPPRPFERSCLLAQPGIITVTIFNFITIWNGVLHVHASCASKARVRPIAVGLYNMVKGMQYTNDYGGCVSRPW